MFCMPRTARMIILDTPRHTPHHVTIGTVGLYLPRMEGYNHGRRSWNGRVYWSEPEIQPLNVLGLMQLVDSAPAVGGYAGCFQVRALARQGLLRSEEQIVQLLDACLKSSIGPSDGVAVGWAFKAARQGDLAELPELASRLSGPDVPANLRLASLEMGAHLWELSRRWDWAQAMHVQVDGMAGPEALHHAMAFGALVSETTAQEIRAIAMCLFSAAKAIIRVAVDAIPLDETVVLKILSRLQPEISSLAHQYATCHSDAIHALPPAEVVESLVRAW